MVEEVYKIEKEGLVVLGDVHGRWSCIVDFCKSYQDYCIIQLGDMGVGFDHPIKEVHKLRKLNKILHESNNELIIFRGNHDRPSPFLGKWVEEEILLAADYQKLSFKDKLIQVVGGGISIDRSDRVIHRSWWPDEEVKFIPEKVAKVDILLTHVPPTAIPIDKSETNPMVLHYHSLEAMQGGNLLEEINHERELIQSISDLSECSQHLCGHFHISQIFIDKEKKRKYTILAIDEFKEIF